MRELRSAIDFAVLACRGSRIGVEDLPPELQDFDLPADAGAAAGPEPELERRILEALGQAHGNRTQAARLVGISRATLYRHLSALGLLRRPEASSPELRSNKT